MALLLVASFTLEGCAGGTHAARATARPTPTLPPAAAHPSAVWSRTIGDMTIELRVAPTVSVFGSTVRFDVHVTAGPNHQISGWEFSPGRGKGAASDSGDATLCPGPDDPTIPAQDLRETFETRPPIGHHKPTFTIRLSTCRPDGSEIQGPDRTVAGYFIVRR